MLTGLRVRPIIRGVLVDIVSTNLVLAAYTAWWLSERGRDVFDPTPEAFITSPEWLLAAVIIGTLCTALGGYVAGRSAAELEVKHGAMVGVVAVAVGLVAKLIPGQAALPFSYEVLAVVIAVPAGAAGGYAAQRHRERSA